MARYPSSGKACFCIALRDVPKHLSLCRMITNVKIKTFSHTISCTVLLRPEGQIFQTTGDTFCNARRDSNPRIESFTGSSSKRSSGIHFGISSCTAVKDLTQTQALSNLASIFYHSVYCFSRKKSCENNHPKKLFGFLGTPTTKKALARGACHRAVYSN